MQRNRLAAETSPYLKQHADNPVDWYPWGAEALERAQREHKPILLSVGYSACHWCHVMAHESFEDPAIAALMNELFVNIKVDREERPDLDKIYQVAQQLLTQRGGGWPLTMFLSPDDQHPFFGGTYFPKQPGHGLPGFGDLLVRVAEYHRTHGAEIRQQSAALALAFERVEAAAAARGGGTGSRDDDGGSGDDITGSRDGGIGSDSRVGLDAAPLVHARQVLAKSFDARHGGFGRAPKFPQPASVERCLRQWYGTSRGPEPDLQALYMATLTLTRMAEGGLYDQVGGGFCRYSTDESWMIPHFEKMLYDNGQLLTLYARAYLATGEPLFGRVAGETADWLLRDMRGPHGAFYASLDADSEGHEGRFYVWTRDEVQALLKPEQYSLIARRFGLDREPNFEGRWHLHAYEPLEHPQGAGAAGANASAAGAPPGAGDAAGAASPLSALDAARATLLAARNRRVWPARDEKILTSWNALTIKGLAVAGRALRRPELTDAAGAAVDFIRHALWRDGRLLATTKDGRAHLPAYLDDYAFLADALLELLQSRWRSSDLAFATQLVDVLLTQFEDLDGGGFYFTAADHEKLIHRSKTFGDDSLPSGNAVAACVLTRMGYLLGEPRLLEAAERTLEAGQPAMLEYPQAHMSLLNALEESLASTEIVVIRGPAADALHWSRQLHALYAPSRMIFAIPGDAPDLPPALAEKRATGTTTAYVCTGMTCSAPLTDLGLLARWLASTP
jgi:uncharacterized protein YyaL (SSP411 family)